MNAEPAFTQGTSNTLSWGSVAGATGYYLEMVPLPAISRTSSAMR